MGFQKGASELDAGDLASLVGGIFGLSKFGRDDDGGGGGGKDDDAGKGNPAPSSSHGTAADVPNLAGKTRTEAEAIIKQYNPTRADTNVEGKYQKFVFADKSEIHIGPDGGVDRIPAPKYGTDGRKVNRGFRIDPSTGQPTRPHTFPETEFIKP